MTVATEHPQYKSIQITKRFYKWLKEQPEDKIFYPSKLEESVFASFGKYLFPDYKVYGGPGYFKLLNEDLQLVHQYEMSPKIWEAVYNLYPLVKVSELKKALEIQ